MDVFLHLMHLETTEIHLDLCVALLDTAVRSGFTPPKPVAPTRLNNIQDTDGHSTTVSLPNSCMAA